MVLPFKPMSLRILVAALACVLSPTFARAGSTYQLVFDQPAYQVDPGAKVGVSVYLQEQVDGGTPSVLAADGLLSAGVRVSFDLSPLPSDPARIVSSTDVTPNDSPAGFAGGFQSIVLNPGSNVELTETVDLSSSGVIATDLGGGLYRILIGTFQFTAGMIAGQTTTIRAGDIPGGSDDWFTGAGDQLDELIGAGTATITVRGAAAVPEPSSVVAMGLGLLGAGGYGLARRRRLAPS